GLDMVHIVPHHIGSSGHFAHIAANRAREGLHFIQHDGFNLLFQRVGQLVTVAAENLDAVELTGVVRGGNHHAGVCLVLSYQKRHGRRGHNAQLHHVVTHTTQTVSHSIFQHIAGKTGVLTAEDLGMAVVVVCQYHCGGAANVHGHLTGQLAV